MFAIYLLTTRLDAKAFFAAGGYNVNLTRVLQYWAPTLIALMVSIIILLFETSIGEKAGRRSIGWQMVRHTQVFGLLTYAVYVWHEPIFIAEKALLSAIVTEKSAIIHLCLAVLKTLLFALITYRLIERPFELKKKGNVRADGGRNVAV